MTENSQRIYRKLEARVTRLNEMLAGERNRDRRARLDGEIAATYLAQRMVVEVENGQQDFTEGQG